MTEIADNNSQITADSSINADLHELFPRRPDLAALRGMRILLVDDLPTNIILAQAILEHGGFNNVITTESGDKALQILEQQTHDGVCSIDIVLLDIILPGKDGYIVCRSIRKHAAWSHIPVIMITSDTKWKEETALAAFESGATDILFKPVRSAELIPRVISTLSLKTERDSRLASERHYRAMNSEHALLEARLKYLVSHDEATGLYNRRRLDQLLELSILYANNYQRESALLCIDINDFKKINDESGFNAGDKLIEETASLLRNFAGDEYHAARIGTNRFAILVEDCGSDIVGTIVNKLVSILNTHDFEPIKQDISFRIGAGFICKDEKAGCSEIIARAEQACEHARHKNNGVYFNAEPCRD